MRGSKCWEINDWDQDYPEPGGSPIPGAIMPPQEGFGGCWVCGDFVWGWGVFRDMGITLRYHHIRLGGI